MSHLVILEMRFAWTGYLAECVTKKMPMPNVMDTDATAVDFWKSPTRAGGLAG
jgi:hypothetical protein